MCTVLSVELVCFSEPLLVVKTEATEIRLPSVSAHQGDQTRELSKGSVVGKTEASRLKARKLPICPCLFRSFCEMACRPTSTM